MTRPPLLRFGLCLSAWTALLAVAIGSASQAQSLSEAALGLIQVSLQCLPKSFSEDHDFERNRITGQGDRFVLLSEHYYTPKGPNPTRMRFEFVGSARFSDLSTGYIDTKQEFAGREWIVFPCKSDKCVTSETICTGHPELTAAECRTHVVESMGFWVCDQQTAQNIIRAFGVLSKLYGSE